MPKKKRNNNSNKNTRKFTTIAILGLVFILSFFMFYLKEEKGITGGVSVNVEEVITPAGSGNVMLNEFFKYSVNISCSGEDCGEINVTLAPRIIQEDFERNQQLENIGPSFIGEAANDWSGYSVSEAGDVNNDGYDDFLIGAPYNDEGGTQAGKTYLILGKANGLERDFNLSNADASFIGENNYDSSGYSVSEAGDVNNDGYDDFLIGAHRNDEEGGDEGKTYLIFGKANGWTRDFNLTNANASFIGEAANDWSGYSVSGAGDVNNDGYGDFLICSIYDAGKTHLILGRADGWTRDFNLTNANASFIGELANDQSGYSVSGAGDVNNDGYDDFLIGSKINSAISETYLILGKENGWTNNFNLSNANASFISEENNDNSGYSVSAAGDVNNDGYDDFLIGANRNNEGVGKTYLILGKANGWTRDVNLTNANASFIGENNYDSSGYSVSGVGDVNSDGYDDFLIGAPSNGSTSGKTYLIFGKANGWTRDFNLTNANASFIGEMLDDWSGCTVSSAGDFNNDGYTDFLIGANRNNEGVGKTYLIFDSQGIGIIPTSDLGLSFYTNATSNPQKINLNDGESETVSFWINTTGGVGRTYEFFVSANKTNNLTNGCFSEKINLKVISNGPEVNLISPLNNTPNNLQTYNFTCNTIDDWNLGNVTLFVWNSSGNLIYNSSTENLTTGIWNDYNKSATFSFEYFLPYADEFKWNCLVYDEEGNSAFAVENYSIIVQNPEITIDWFLPFTNSNVTQNNFNLLSFNVSCSNSNCGALNVSLDPTCSAVNLSKYCSNDGGIGF